MGSRLRAVFVAVMGLPLPLVSQATVCLVTLRKGPQEGGFILLWSLLPILAVVIAGGGDLLMTATGAALVVGVIGANLLRTTISWPAALMGSAGVATAISLLIGMIAGDEVVNTSEQLAGMIAEMQSSLPEDQRMAAPQAGFIIGLIGYLIMMNSVMCLLLARWWQSLLYNPGGFQQEFHQLRLNPWSTIVCLAATMYCHFRGGDYQTWALVFQMPLLIAGVAIVHWQVKRSELGGGWLAAFYLALVLFSPLQLLLVGLAAMDTWIDIRARLASKSASSRDQ